SSRRRHTRFSRDWSSDVCSSDLDEVKAVAKATGTTVNDVLIANLAGALRAYMLDKGDNPNEKVIRATVPVNLRPLKHAKELGNHFGLVFLNLPIFERSEEHTSELQSRENLVCRLLLE